MYIFRQYLKSVIFTGLLFTLVPIAVFTGTYNILTYIWGSFGWSLGISLSFSFISFIVNIFIISEMDKNYVLDDAVKFSALSKEEWQKETYNKSFEKLIK
jgi:hypothetical protein